MRKNAMKPLMMALLMAVAAPFVNAQVQVGDILCEGDTVVRPADYDTASYRAIGVVFHVDETGEHGWAVSLYNDGNHPWCKYGEDTPLDNVKGKGRAARDIDGNANTKAILEKGEKYTAFTAVDFENGWYLPAVGQLKKLYARFDEVNATLKEMDGDLFKKTGYTYWSSTECTPYDAWYLCSIGGISRTSNSHNDCKSTLRLVRAVKTF